MCTWLVGMQVAQRVPPTLFEKALVGAAALRLEEDVIVPGFGRISKSVDTTLKCHYPDVFCARC